ncbi:MAG TPA: deoxyribodipyrimidine photo-lyase [Oligoflexia bacterium]|nr:deoxyribodipyrimidine photo-lyase [Oligoflexia bacterium]HMP49400.1 deoxyribodipyrimidine photo-lyase [Oligoflexia bacterium]
MAKISHKTSLFWFRRDLRVKDNEALHTAANESDFLICIYIHSPKEESPWPPGGASRWWLHHALSDLEKNLKKLGSHLIIKSGSSADIIKSIAEENSVSKVYWNRLYDPTTIKRDIQIKEELTSANIKVFSFPGSLLKEPWEIKNSSGNPYQVFTPFWRALSGQISDLEPDLEIRKFPPSTKTVHSDELSTLKLLPKISWDKEFYPFWKPTEKGAWDILENFIISSIQDYKTERDFPFKQATSFLSPYLHFGQITPKSIWRTIHNAFNSSKVNSIEPFLRQLGWRDFAHHLLYHFPHTDSEPLKSDFKNFPWQRNKPALSAWQKGQTGVPIVDAGMRELWATGIMHNRVRMIAASFLVKNLRIHWIEGAKWFWDTLVDADLANNSLGWQWVAGSGADAAPYFRIFNPVSQSEKFDSEGLYIRKWVPEISSLPDKWIHKPWEAPKNVLDAANVILGKTYPKLLCDLKATREEALNAYYSLKK